jgi:hypothetical protein
MHIKSLAPLALGALLCGSPIQADTTDGLIIGGMAGLTAGFVTSAIARCSNQHRCHRPCERVYVEQPPRVIEKPIYIEKPPRIIERPVVIEKVIEHRPVVVEERIRHNHVTTHQPQPVIAPTQSITERELAVKEQQLKLDLLKEENRKRELKIKELELELEAMRKTAQKNS